MTSTIAPLSESESVTTQHPAWQRTLAAAVSAVLFGAGLVLSGMTQPAKVIGFLDVSGAWDPSLMFVMVGAIGVHALAWRFIKRAPQPVLGGTFQVPTNKAIDARLVVGAALFGIGWGVSGICPGPGLVALASNSSAVLAFVGAMFVGMAIVSTWQARQVSLSLRRWWPRATHQTPRVLRARPSPPPALQPEP
jgi:uncharacterized membrane protein YedE/YeeE